MRKLIFAPVCACLHFFKRKKSFKHAFSLVELLIALIVLSLLLAAFAPLITKKIKAVDITVGSLGTSSNSIEIKRNVTKEDCDKFNAMYIPAVSNDGQKPVCVTKWNIGDAGGPSLHASAVVLSAGSSCSTANAGNCCWRGTTAATCGQTGNGNSTYSGCTRTIAGGQ